MLGDCARRSGAGRWIVFVADNTKQPQLYDLEIRQCC